jgi:hypothetical protein
MSPNRALLESLAKDHTAELHGRARRRAQISRAHSTDTTRTRAGWLLIGLGMRLIAGHGRATNQLNAAAGR